MVQVIASGVFDILHPGHLYYLKESKKLGDKLTVILARDSTAEKIKGKRPHKSEKIRKEILEAIKYVDKVVLGIEIKTKKGRERILKQLKPDIIALGYDQELGSGEFKTVRIQKKGSFSSSNYI